jgi:hypothetical protein
MCSAPRDLAARPNMQGTDSPSPYQRDCSGYRESAAGTCRAGDGPHILCQRVVREGVGVGALPVEFLLGQRGVILQRLLVFFALLALRWLAGHCIGLPLAHGQRRMRRVVLREVWCGLVG